MPNARMLALGALLAVGGACVDVRLRLIGGARRSRPTGCAVDLFPGEKFPRYEAFFDVAYAEVRCRKRDRCIDELRKQACAVGARAVYWSWEETRDGYTEIDAHFAVPTTRPSGLELGSPGGRLR
jgi:hypothetical protein